MKDNNTPVRQADFILEQLDNDYQLRYRSEETAVFINATAALLWELCDGKRTVAEIKDMLRAAYPDAGSVIDKDIDESLSILLGHNALSCK